MSEHKPHFMARVHIGVSVCGNLEHEEVFVAQESILLHMTPPEPVIRAIRALAGVEWPPKNEYNERMASLAMAMALAQEYTAEITSRPGVFLVVDDEEAKN